MDFFYGLRIARAALLELSVAGANARRLKMLPDRVVIEIAQPLAGAISVVDVGDYQKTELCECDVVWRRTGIEGNAVPQVAPAGE